MKKFVLASSVLLGLASMGCNGLTGAERFGVDDEEITVSDEPEQSRAPATKKLSCRYPTDGTTGVDTGNLVPASLSYTPTLIPGGETGTLNISDLFDCDGSKGINAIVLITAKYF